MRIKMTAVLLVFATMPAVLWAQTSDFAQSVSMLSFILVRLLQSIVYTYVVVTNPIAYLELRVKNHDGK